MFTGIVEGRGAITALIPDGAALTLNVRPPADMLDGCVIGASVSINGCCLTVVEISDDTWSFQAGSETLSKTNLGRLEVGSLVNLERSLPVDGRLGGHFVQGHVDSTGTVDAIEPEGEWAVYWFEVPAALTRQMVPKGSIAVDGISLTVVDVEQTRFSVALIPHTLEVTTLGSRAVGDVVNVETDILGKYAEKLMGVSGNDQ